jgi:hypothetical protein
MASDNTKLYSILASSVSVSGWIARREKTTPASISCQSRAGSVAGMVRGLVCSLDSRHPANRHTDSNLIRWVGGLAYLVLACAGPFSTQNTESRKKLPFIGHLSLIK